MELTRYNITFLRNVPSDIKIDMSTRWRYHYFNGSIAELDSYIKLIKDDSIYLLIPIFADSNSITSATLNLSQPFLVDNKSNSVLIINFILAKYKTSIFEIKQGISVTFALKFKRVWFHYK